MEFRQLTPANIPDLKPYFQHQPFRLSNYSLGFHLMWHPYAKTAVAEAEGCLLIRMAYGGKICFAYPVHPQADETAEFAALDKLEAHCVETGTPLRLEAIPAERLTQMVVRYGRDMTLTNPRTWRDYLYTFSDFVEYAGKRFSGQRNHVSKFKRNYPDATFRQMQAEDSDRVHAFLKEYAERQYAKNSFIANEELHGSEALLKAFTELNLLGGILEHEGKIIAITLGEIVGDTLIVHVEKALVGYEGVYPSIAQAFARSCQRPELLYINREDDAGDCGLRKSKLQYNPIRLLDKYAIVPRRLIEELEGLPEITSERLVLRAVPAEDVHTYARLAKDRERNRLWGWDWRTAWTGEGDPRDVWFLEISRKDFAARREVQLGIYFRDQLVGEGVFHNFTYHNTVELGVRLLAEYEHQGFATEAMRTMANYALCFWGLEAVTAKCYKENLHSKKMLLASGLRAAGEDDTFFYFARTAKH